MKKNYIIPALRVVNSNLDLDICEVSLEVTDKPANPDPSQDLVPVPGAAPPPPPSGVHRMK